MSCSIQQSYLIRALGLLVGITVFLTGCVGGGSSPLVRFYLLNPEEGISGTPVPSTLSLNIDQLLLPEYLDRPHLVTRSGDNRLTLSESHQWGGSLRKNLKRVLMINLSRQLGSEKITSSVSHSDSHTDFHLTVDILQFELLANSKVSLIAQWRLSRGGGREPVVSRMTELSSDPLITAGDHDGVVKEMGRLFAALSHVIASEIGQQRK